MAGEILAMIPTVGPWMRANVARRREVAAFTSGGLRASRMMSSAVSMSGLRPGKSLGGSVGWRTDSAHGDRFPGVHVNDDPISEWFLKWDLNDVLAVVATSERSGGGDYLNLHVLVGFPQE